MVTSFILALIALLGASLKVMLIQAPHSTDLEVHRHWKALTYNLPLSQWYTDVSSVWTLDYPPGFAYLEYFLANILSQIHPALLHLHNHNYSPFVAVAALRLSLLVFDPVLAISVFQHSADLLSFVFVILSPALTIVDNIHFQYNIIPIALLFFVLGAFQRKNVPLASLLFTTAVHLKHTLLPLALPFLCHALAIIPRLPHPIATFSRSAILVVLVLVLIWFPFYHVGGIPLLHQILARMFPFHRGLMHANWGPSYWAVHAVLDKLLIRLGFAFREPDGSITTGVLGARQPFGSLPNPTPRICVALQVIATTPALSRVMKAPSSASLSQAVVVTGITGILFGWHVHEKALLIPLLVLAGSALHSLENAVAFTFLSPAAHLSIMDLVVREDAAEASQVFIIIYHLIVLATLTPAFPRIVRHTAIGYSGLAIVIAAFVYKVDSVLLGNRYPFLPYIVVSLYSFLGVAVSYAILCTPLLKRINKTWVDDVKLYT